MHRDYTPDISIIPHERGHMMDYSLLLDTVSALFTLLGFVAVIISLQQTRTSINAAPYQHILRREAEDWNIVEESSPAVKARALRNFGITVTGTTFTPDMDILIDRIGIFNFYEGIFFLHRQGALNTEVWENWKRRLAHIMENRDIRGQWEIGKHIYNPLFAE